MQVYLKQDVVGLGLEGQIVKVKDGLARNRLIPQGLAIQITRQNETTLRSKERTVKVSKEAVSSKTSLLAERIRDAKVVLKERAHDGGLLYGAVSAGEVVAALAKVGISAKKSQIVFDKSIKKCGVHSVTVRLSSTLKAKFNLTIKPTK
jgi:large subunit ribosomal protein L9